MSETKFELRQPVTPLSRTLREGEMATEHVIKAVKRLEAINAKLLAALEEIALASVHHTIVGYEAAQEIGTLAREAIKEAKGES